MIETRIFELFGSLARGGDATPAETTDHFRCHLDLWHRAEALGFEGIFFSEHHFGLTFGPSPNLLIVPIAAVTKMPRRGDGAPKVGFAARQLCEGGDR